MKYSPLKKKFFIGLTVALLLGTTATAASIGVIDPANNGSYKAAFLDSSVVADPSINFGKFSTQSQYNITVTDTELRGYAWGASVGYIVMNCADTTSGCSATNGNFKVANKGGLLSGYAWGENTGWINFGPFTSSSISTVKIDTSGKFMGTLGSAGYAWSQNYGWIIFDCANANTCVVTNWNAVQNGGGTSGGGTITPTNPTTPTTPENPITPPVSPAHPTTPPAHPSTPSQTPSDTGTAAQEPDTTVPDNTTGPVEAPTGDTTTPTDIPTQSEEPGAFANGLQLPPALSEAFGTIATAVGSVLTAAKNIGTDIVNIFRTSDGQAASHIVAGVSFVAAIVGMIAVAALATPIALAELALLPLQVWSLILIAFGLKKNPRTWGTVYNSVTKQPIMPAYVVLTDMEGNTVATSMTDAEGRYGFSVPPGTYKIAVRKANFDFPSKQLEGQSTDELYPNIYHGQVVTVTEDGAVVATNIPLDQHNFSWNQFATTTQPRLSFLKHTDMAIAQISSLLFGIGLLFALVSTIAQPNAFNGIMLAVYVVLLLVRQYSPQHKVRGSITDAAGTPLPFAIMHLYSPATGQEVTHAVADRLGHYHIPVPNGTYSASIDKKNADGTYTKIPVQYPITVTKGYVQEDFKI